MNIFVRILLTIYAFVAAVISVVLIIMAIRPVNISYLTNDLFEYLTLSFNAKLALVIVAAVFFIVSMIFLLSGTKSNKDKKAIIKTTEMGEIRISLSSIENISLSATKSINGLKDTKVYAIREKDEVAIIIKTDVLSDLNIPELCKDIQIKVKNQVEQNVQVIVKEVKVIVEGIQSAYKNRVE